MSGWGAQWFMRDAGKVPGVVDFGAMSMVIGLSRTANRFGGRHSIVWALVIVGAILGGCTPQKAFRHIFGRNHVMEGMNPQVSINVLVAPWWWPDEDTFREKYNKLGDIQEQYYTDHGRPDFLRLLFNKQGTILPYGVISSRQGVPEPKGVAWIYIDRDVEVTFEPGGPVEKPISDEVVTLCQLGDPDDIKPIGSDQTIRNVRYVYNREGLHMDFLDGKKVAEKQVQPMPDWMRSSNM